MADLKGILKAIRPTLRLLLDDPMRIIKQPIQHVGLNGAMIVSFIMVISSFVIVDQVDAILGSLFLLYSMLWTLWALGQPVPSGAPTYPDAQAPPVPPKTRGPSNKK